MSNVFQHNVQTNESIVRSMNADEEAIIQASIAQVAQEQAIIAARQAARQSAISKLAALGLTVDEISAAFGLDS